MRAILVAFIALSLAAGLRAETYTLPDDNSRLTVNTPAGWSQSHTDFASELVFRFTPNNSKTNAIGVVTLTYVGVEEFSTKDKLSREVADMARQFVAAYTAGPRQPAVKPLRCKQGFGFFFSFDDPSMASKQSKPGNYKQITGGRILLEPGVVVKVEIYSDGDKTEGYQQLRAMVEGLELKH